ncbi:MAG TPA: sulfite exporter TauE/SafE family protein [Hyphomicrobiaceae bacterium]|nr:sulfite exporter TauE/SafE family protein [Hyphomicrobiaceae bacterium]
MSTPLLIALFATSVATSFLSGLFGMAGGMILIGVLLTLLTVPEAMALHAVAQLASNSWRGLLWLRHVRWRTVTAYMSGSAVALVALSFLQFVPSKPLALLSLGISPFLVRLLPRRVRPDPQRLLHGAIYGSACMSLMLLAGVAGPLLDTYFIGGTLSRKEIVATKAVCQIFGHAAKLLYFGGLIAQSASIDPTLVVMVVVASMIGTMAAKPVLERLTDVQYRRWATYLIMVIACVYLVQGSYMLAWAAK